MNLPPFPPLGDTALRAIAASVGATAWRQLPDVGLFNTLFVLDEKFVLRIPRQAPEFVEALEKEAVVIPHVCSVGIKTPKLVTFDNSRQLLETPFIILEYVRGKNLAALTLDPETVPQTWRDVGEQLAQLHLEIQETKTNTALRSFSLPSARDLNRELARAGYYTPLEEAWLETWLQHLSTFFSEPVIPVFGHGDMQTTNLMVDEEGDFLGLIDWGASGWLDPAHDFAGVPLRVVPFMLEGYEKVLGDQGEAFKARILMRHLQLALYLVNRPPTPRHAWAERPLGMLLEITRFVARQPKGWQQLLS